MIEAKDSIVMNRVAGSRALKHSERQDKKLAVEHVAPCC
jgi:hypothetical protein